MHIISRFGMEDGGIFLILGGFGMLVSRNILLLYTKLEEIPCGSSPLVET